MTLRVSSIRAFYGAAVRVWCVPAVAQGAPGRCGHVKPSLLRPSGTLLAPIRTSTPSLGSATPTSSKPELKDMSPTEWPILGRWHSAVEENWNYVIELNSKNKLSIRWFYNDRPSAKMCEDAEIVPNREGKALIWVEPEYMPPWRYAELRNGRLGVWETENREKTAPAGEPHAWYDDVS
eukprot:TRINITY_DN23256_c0_g1_i1.p2 TRINITY_DN23256_c0_g1~~TRINITY_DN23256_c0_g1_i1.p2  ORF type:complete len:179 (-),score=2.64 TRINITY_DN23256_c0_g1_i1:205-741(-)